MEVLVCRLVPLCTAPRPPRALQTTRPTPSLARRARCEFWPHYGPLLRLNIPILSMAPTLPLPFGTSLPLPLPTEPTVPIFYAVGRRRELNYLLAPMSHTLLFHVLMASFEAAFGEASFVKYAKGWEAFRLRGHYVVQVETTSIT